MHAPSCACGAGGDLDPLEVLHALGEGVPLAVAVPTLERMLRERIHRARQGTVLKHLHRACHLSAASERAEVGLLVPGLHEQHAACFDAGCRTVGDDG